MTKGGTPRCVYDDIAMSANNIPLAAAVDTGSEFLLPTATEFGGPDL